MSAPNYHDLYVTTPDIRRTKLSDLPFGHEVTCNRVGGWSLWVQADDHGGERMLGAEYDDQEHWLVLDVAGHVIVDSRESEPS